MIQTTVLLHGKNGEILAHEVYRETAILNRLPDKIKMNGKWYVKSGDISYSEEEEDGEGTK